MLPYLGKYIHKIELFGVIPIQPFGVLVGLAIVVGYFLALRRIRKVGLDPKLYADGVVWIVVSGFVMAHLVSEIFYFPDRILDDPLVLFTFWNGLSSFGGFIGAAIGAYVFFKRRGAPILKYVDAIVFGFVPAWIIGRMGCTVVFDHPGVPTDFILGMADRAGVVRHNLGMYEMGFAVVLTAILYALRNFKPFDGFHTALMLLLYTPVRFLLDSLRIEDKTYLGLTPGQYFAGGMLLLAVILIVHGLRQRHLAAPDPGSA